jgi:hypothetical protein
MLGHRIHFHISRWYMQYMTTVIHMEESFPYLCYLPCHLSFLFHTSWWYMQYNTLLHKYFCPRILVHPARIHLGSRHLASSCVSCVVSDKSFLTRRIYDLLQPSIYLKSVFRCLARANGPKHDEWRKRCTGLQEVTNAEGKCVESIRRGSIVRAFRVFGDCFGKL